MWISLTIRTLEQDLKALEETGVRLQRTKSYFVNLDVASHIQATPNLAIITTASGVDLQTEQPEEIKKILRYLNDRMRED